MDRRVRSVFITGTDTGVGKSFFCGLLGRFFQDKGYKVVTQKWVQTGCEGFAEDLSVHLEFMGKSKEEFESWHDDMSVYTFKLAASPHLAAEVENTVIDAGKIKSSFQRLSNDFDVVIAEGAGGVLVPYDRGRVMIDIAKELGLCVIIVAQNKLGAINHTLLTIEAVRHRGMEIVGIVFNSCCHSVEEAIVADNPEIIRQLGGEMILGTLPWSQDREILIEEFEQIGERTADRMVEIS